jgi:hypothetical protein
MAPFGLVEGGKSAISGQEKQIPRSSAAAYGLVMTNIGVIARQRDPSTPLPAVAQLRMTGLKTTKIPPYVSLREP